MPDLIGVHVSDVEAAGDKPAAPCVATDASVAVALREAKARIDELIRHSPAAIFEFRFDPPSFVHVNDAMSAILGYTEEELLTMDPAELLDDEGRERLKSRMVAHAGGDTADTTAEYRIRRKDGDCRHVVLNVRYSADADGPALSAFVVGHDVTEQRRAELRARLLGEANATLLASSDAEAAIQSIAESVMRYLECDVFFNYVFDHAAGSLRLNAYGGIAPHLAEQIGTLQLGVAICGCVAMEGERLVSEDVQRNGDERASLVRSLGVQAYACHPLRIGGMTVGTLSFGSRRRTSFTDDELDLMRAVTDYVSVAMQRARSEAELRRQEERQSFLLGLTDAVRPLQDAEEIANEACRLLAEQLGVLDVRYVEPGLVGASSVDEEPLLVVPLVKSGERVAAFLIDGPPAHGVLGEDQLQLAEDALDRTWGSVRRARTEAALREGESRFRAVLEYALDAAYRRDLVNDCYDYLSPVIEAITGFPVDEFKNLSLDELLLRIHPDDREMVRDCIVQSEQTGRLICEYRFRGRDDEYVWLSDYAVVVKGPDGTPLYRSGVVRDATQRKVVDEALRESLDRTTLLKELASAVASTLDPRELCQRVARVTKEFLGADMTIIYLLETPEGPARPAAFAGIANAGDPIAVDMDSLTGRAIMTRETQFGGVEPLPPATQRRAAAGGMLGFRFEAMPVTVREQVVASIVFGFDGIRAFEPEEVELHRAVADHLSTGLEKARLYEVEHSIAETLQETLVSLPERVPGVALSRAYESATFASGRVGGDFVDVFTVHGPVVGITLGDVSGKGMDAAVTTSLIRTTLRVHAIDGLAPAEVARKANEVMRRFTEVDSFVTLWFGLLDTTTGHLRYVCAGHPPALLLACDGTVKALDCKDPILGAFDSASFFESQAMLSPNDRLVVYSDGVSEARSAFGAFLNEDGFVGLLRAHATDATEVMGEALMREVVAYSDGVLRDDAAVLVVEATGLTLSDERGG